MMALRFLFMRVALRKESVDRNSHRAVNVQSPTAVALRKESVDRNGGAFGRRLALSWSLSARRAWIEMVFCGPQGSGKTLSLSARRAWIEMTNKISESQCTQVALRKESVDRNGAGSWRLAMIPVALRKESVDRNVAAPCVLFAGGMSLSARRAWNVSLSDCSGWFCSCGYPL